MSMNKEIQLEIINKFNPMLDDYHTGVRSTDDIKTYREALDYDDYIEGGYSPDYSEDMIKQAIKTGKITVYSSYSIKQGTFVTPSKMEAQCYAGQTGKVFCKEVKLEDVAWLDGMQGQYANIKEFDEIEKSYDEMIEEYALEIMDKYSITPARNDIPKNISDFELVKIREDNFRSLNLKPYEFITKHIEQNFINELSERFHLPANRIAMFIEYLAQKVYELCRSDLARLDRFNREINRIMSKYFERHKLDALGEMYDKCDIYDEVGREKFIDERAKKWDKVLKSDKKDILRDVILSGLYKEDSPENKELTEKHLLPNLSKMIATFERDDLEHGLRKDAREEYFENNNYYDEER